MAAHGIAIKLIGILAMITLCMVAHGNDIEVGGENGWVMVQVGDTIYYFQYKNDSVMVVTQEDYNNCNCTHPIFFSNNGNTRYELDHAGLFYYISGVEGRCELGQKMIVKVLNRLDDISLSGFPPDKAPSPLPPLSPSSGHEHSGAKARIRDINRMASVLQLFVVMFGGFLLV